MAKTKIKVESGMPIDRPRGRGRPAKYPFAKLKVGQTFFVPGTTTHVFSAAVHFWNAKKGNKAFRATGIDKDGEPITKDGKKGVRVRRVK